jgi:N-methylhydantoinase B/oxoprolinase/acetone carboxylase alpha subunit
MSGATDADRGLETEILWSRIQTTAEEMYDTAGRLAFSTSIRDSSDVSTAVLTANGDAIGMSDRSVPVLSGAISNAARNILESHVPPEDLQAGDVVVTNDPWLGGGHLSDVVLLSPVFYDGDLVGLTGALGHVGDIGGTSGGWSTDNTEMYEEGLLIPPLKLYEGGERVHAIKSMIRNNVRVPDQILGDLEALRSANTFGAARLRDIIDDRGLDVYLEVTGALLDRSEQALRGQLETVEDGVYEHELVRTEHDVTVAINVTVDGETIDVDFAGSSPQVDAGINCPFTNTRAVTAYVVKCMLIPDVSNTDGLFRPLSISAPEGSVVNCTRPRATLARHVTYAVVEDALIRALSKAVPDSAISESAGIQVLNFSGTDESGEDFVAHTKTDGGFPARANADGIGAVIFPYNGTNVPIEVLEHYFPLRVERYDFETDSEGAGRYRSGPAHEMVIHNPTDRHIDVAVTSDKATYRPTGFGGGEAGVSADASSSLEDIEVPLNGRTRIAPGETLQFRSASPGGVGDPTERDNERVADDVENGYVSPERAREVYGYDPDGTD